MSKQGLPLLPSIRLSALIALAELNKKTRCLSVRAIATTFLCERENHPLFDYFTPAVILFAVKLIGMIALLGFPRLAVPETR
jgi:hypothetical protein